MKGVSLEKSVNLWDHEVEASEVFGPNDVYLKMIEEHFRVGFVCRDDKVIISGDEKAVEKAAAVLEYIQSVLKKDNFIDEQSLSYAINQADMELSPALFDTTPICHTFRGRPVKPKTQGQREYIQKVKSNDIVVCIGPAGTGKTYLAVAMAVAAYKGGDVERIILTRPAVEAGESLGFLPGDLKEKVDPYLRPLYDALYDIMGFETYERLISKGIIEIAPLAYMRGRTLDNAFIILDEAQNATAEQIKMFLTRLGFSSKAIITGDATQIDLPGNKKSGLLLCEKILHDVTGIGFSHLMTQDVVRNPLVQRIVRAYENYENKK